MTRYTAAAILALLLAVYATIFARQTYNHIDAPIILAHEEWLTALLFVGAAWAAWQKREQLAAVFIVSALFLFYAVQADWLFRVPLGFGLITVGALTFLFTLPVTWKPK